jgi:hypothetical protein
LTSVGAVKVSRWSICGVVDSCSDLRLARASSRDRQASSPRSSTREDTRACASPPDRSSCRQHGCGKHRGRAAHACARAVTCRNGSQQREGQRRAGLGRRRRRGRRRRAQAKVQPPNEQPATDIPQWRRNQQLHGCGGQDGTAMDPSSESRAVVSAHMLNCR